MKLNNIFFLLEYCVVIAVFGYATITLWNVNMFIGIAVSVALLGLLLLPIIYYIRNKTLPAKKEVTKWDIFVPATLLAAFVILELIEPMGTFLRLLALATVIELVGNILFRYRLGKSGKQK